MKMSHALSPVVISLLCFLASGDLLSQVVVGGNVQMSGNIELKGGIAYSGTWSDTVRRTTLAIGIIQPDEVGAKHFATGGAAVLIRDDKNRVFIATALHVFSNPSEHWDPESLQIRGWQDELTSRYRDFGTTLILKDHGKPLYVSSTRFDLAIIKAPDELFKRLIDKDQKIYVISPGDIGSSNDIYDGADVFILGFPGLVGEEYQQRALMRSGIVAWTDSSGVTDHEFLVDSRIFPGNSGGPVFSSAGGMTRDASLSTGRPIKLLGLVSKTVNAKPELAIGTSIPNQALVIGAASVGVIEPADELVHMMNQIP